MVANTVHLDDDELPVNPTEYRELIGMLNYYQSVYRPELSYFTSVASSFMQAPTVFHWRMVERGFRYVMGTKDICIRFHRDSDFTLVAWADASFQSRDRARSQSGYCFSLGLHNAMFYAKSQKQTVCAQSSTEAEYISLFNCSTEAVWISDLIDYMYLPTGPVIIYQDNLAAIHWAAGQDNFQASKHVDRKLHYTRDLWSSGVIDIRYCPTSTMIADILTKPLIKEKFVSLRDALLGLW